MAFVGKGDCAAFALPENPWNLAFWNASASAVSTLLRCLLVVRVSQVEMGSSSVLVVSLGVTVYCFNLKWDPTVEGRLSAEPHTPEQRAVSSRLQ
jgi:hypothetical protein